MLRVVVVVALVSVVVYAIVWGLQTLRLRGSSQGARAARPAPDDDPAFLAEIDRKIAAERRRREREARQATANAAHGVEPATESDDVVSGGTASRVAEADGPSASPRSGTSPQEPRAPGDPRNPDEPRSRQEPPWGQPDPD